jgi:hypothetical protein
MADLKFQLDMDRTAVLELKLGTYIRGDRGQQGPQGEDGPAGTLTDADQATLQDAIDESAASAAAALQSQGAAAGSATAAQSSAQQAAGSVTAAGASATQSANSAQQAAQSATSAAASESDVAQSAQTATAAATAAGNSQTAAHTSETNSANSAAAALASQNAAAGSATAAGTSATAAGTSATNAAASATTAQNASGLILLQTQGPINGGATQNVFNNFVGPYDEYEMVVTGLVAYTDLSQFIVQFSHDNGATFINAQYAYVQMFNSGATVAVNSQTAQNVIQMWGNVSGIGSGAPWGQINGIIRFYNFAAAGATPARLPYCTFDLGGIGSTGSVTSMKGSGALVALNGQPVNGIRIACSGEGFQGGTLSLFGRRR